MINRAGYQSAYMNTRPEFTGYNQIVRKLENGLEVSAREAQTVLSRIASGVRQNGTSHKVYTRSDGKSLTLAVHDKKLKPYQLRNIRDFIA